MTPEDRMEYNAAQREKYAQDPHWYRTKYRNWLTSLPPDRRAEVAEKSRLASRRRRQRLALASMMGEARDLMEMMRSDDE